MSKTVIVGGTLKDAARRFADAWNRAERGEAVESQDTTTFVSWSALAAVMSDKRYELLRHLHAHPAVSIRALARDLGRDYKRVHEDIAALAAVGLVERDGDLWRADYDEIHTSITLQNPPAAA
jgi:predicted transcriptional regulator